ncbi:hypothetical protein COJ96_02615 [Bacillus sp. AFS073361]|nr:hypothetical protein COJ96_02615 [Bacillus sp. AFS073361]
MPVSHQKKASTVTREIYNINQTIYDTFLEIYNINQNSYDLFQETYDNSWIKLGSESNKNDWYKL